MTVCYPEMQEQAARAKYERKHEKAPWHDGTFETWAAEPTKDTPYHFRHGTNIWVAETDLGLGGDFLTTGHERGSDERDPTEDHEDDG